VAASRYITRRSDIFSNTIWPISNFYDLLLIDVNMPMMDGFQLAQKLLQKDLNVRFMTAGEINMDAAREVHPLKSIGCFIKKPISTEQLLRRIRAELE
jgi:DNA-binding response OmpR family regulator